MTEQEPTHRDDLDQVAAAGVALGEHEREPHERVRLVCRVGPHREVDQLVTTGDAVHAAERPDDRFLAAR